MWDYDSLYQKARAFVRKGLEHEVPGSAEVPLWCILALELLARATLSRINIALLADPKDDASVLFACGFQGKRAPRSIPATMVFGRCMVVCKDFSEQDRRRCVKWLNWRNEELHTGSVPFEGLRTGVWLPDFYRICTIFLSRNETDLEDFVGAEHATTAKEMVESISDQKKAEANKEVLMKKNAFQTLSVEERLERIKQGSVRAKNSQYYEQSKEIKCPSCEGTAFVFGRLVRSTTPKDSDGELVQDDVWLPVVLVCYCCSLMIKGHALVSALGFGDQFVTPDVLDPKDYYQIEIDSSEWHDPEDEIEIDSSEWHDPEDEMEWHDPEDEMEWHDPEDEMEWHDPEDER